MAFVASPNPRRSLSKIVRIVPMVKPLPEFDPARHSVVGYTIAVISTVLGNGWRVEWRPGARQD